MILQEKEGYIWEANKTKKLPIIPWRYAEMGGELLADLLPSGKFGCLSGPFLL